MGIRMYDQKLVKVKDTNTLTNEIIMGRPVKSKHLKRKEEGSEGKQVKINRSKTKVASKSGCETWWREREGSAIKTTTSLLVSLSVW